MATAPIKATTRGYSHVQAISWVGLPGGLLPIIPVLCQLRPISRLSQRRSEGHRSRSPLKNRPSLARSMPIPPTFGTMRASTIAEPPPRRISLATAKSQSSFFPATSRKSRSIQVATSSGVFASLPERNQQKRIGWRPKPGAWPEHFTKGSGVPGRHQDSGENIIRAGTIDVMP